MSCDRYPVLHAQCPLRDLDVNYLWNFGSHVDADEYDRMLGEVAQNRAAIMEAIQESKKLRDAKPVVPRR